jgi:Holliday junction resolvase RusA-like endonuclease
MRCIAQYNMTSYPPVLTFYVHGAPHRRVHVALIKSYRAALIEACKHIGLAAPIDHPIDLVVVFIDPTSPDLDNLLTALYRALDGKTRRGVLVDDSLVHSVKMMKLLNE